MSFETLAELAWKSALVAALSLLLIAAARRRSAAERSLLAETGVLSLLLLPLSLVFLPRIEIAPPAPLVQVLAAVPVEAATVPEAAAPVAAEAAGALQWSEIAFLLYLVPVAIMLAALLVSLVRLHRLRNRARMIEDGRWLTALAAAQNRVGIRHGTALLTSPEINSPISWGILRPVIVIDQSAIGDFDRAEAIIAHELAHVGRLDWAKLILARVATAVFWFNPLVWLLARGCHQLREEAADDAVLRSEVNKADYARLLVTAVRHANAGPLLAANGVAPSKSSLSLRVAHVLDASRKRTPARVTWAAASLALAAGANAALAAADPVIAPTTGIDPTAGERAAAELHAIGTPHTVTLARAIRRRDWSIRRVAGPTTFNEPRAVRPLLLALRDDQPAVRRIAVWGLSELRPGPDPLATPPVSDLLTDPSPEVRAEAAGAIGDFASVRNSRSIEKLLLRDPSADVRLRAAHALGDIQDPGSRQTLEAARSDPDTRVRAKAAWALRQVADAERLMNR